jgi:type II secretory pathway component PulF
LAAQGARGEERPLAIAVAAWRRDVYDGRSIAQALRTSVPIRESLILEAGASDLARAFQDAAGLVETSRKMNAAVAGALIYPCFLAALLSGLLWIFSVRAIPAFAAIKPIEQWTGTAATLGLIAQCVHDGLIPGLLLLFSLLIAAVWSLPHWTGAGRSRADRLPPWSLYKLVSGTSFLVALAAFLRAAVPLPEALRRLALDSDAWLRERIDATLYYVASGHDLGEALSLTGFDFPSREMIDDLRIHASLGGIEESLRRLSSTWVTESLEKINRFADFTKVAGMVAMAGAIAWVQLGILAIQRQLSGN